MATPFPRAQFLALIANIVGVPPSYVTWKGQPEPTYLKPASPLLWASFRIGGSSRSTIGTDDLKYQDNGDGTFTANTYGRRQLILGIDCFTWDSTLTDDAADLLDELTTKIASPSNLDSLNGMALVFETFGAITPIPTFINSRFVSAAHIDMTVALAFADTALFPGGNQWIGEVTGTGTGMGPAIPLDVKDH